MGAPFRLTTYRYPFAAIYPATWGISQLVTGALSDRVGRKWLIASGMCMQALGIVVVILSITFTGFATGGVLLGIGTAMVYLWRGHPGEHPLSASIVYGGTLAMRLAP